MDLVKIKWTKEDFKIFRSYLYDIRSSDEKRVWRNGIVKSNLDVLSIYQKDIKKITNEILKNEYFENYLKDTNFIYYEETLIYGNIISHFKDFKRFEHYLDKLSVVTENWATCDNLNFKNVYKSDKDILFNLSLKYINDDLLFKRRIGLLMLFEFINDEKYEKEIFKILDSLLLEDEYYVNMAASWLLCELFIKSRDNALRYYKSNKTNKFIVNKSISKCRDSFRVSKKDKELLLSFKVL